MLETDGRLDPHFGIGAGVVSPELDRPFGRLARRCRIRRQENGWSHVVVRRGNRAAEREIRAERFVLLIGLVSVINLRNPFNLISPFNRFNDFNDPFFCGPGGFLLLPGAARAEWPPRRAVLLVSTGTSSVAFRRYAVAVEAEPDARPGVSEAALERVGELEGRGITLRRILCQRPRKRLAQPVERRARQLVERRRRFGADRADAAAPQQLVRERRER